MVNSELAVRAQNSTNRASSPTDTLNVVQKAVKALRSYFGERDSALNLAIFRIAIFATLLCQLDDRTLFWYAHLPPELISVPTGGKYLLALAANTPAHVSVVLGICRCACWFGIIGLFSRASAAIATISGAYLLLLTHLIDGSPHQQHIIWFLALVACSRCADMLSIDALIDCWRNKRPSVDPSRRSLIYGLPLRFVWLLFGIIYFWPGLWKLKLAGFDWAFGDGLQHVIYYKWTTLGGWVSPLRIDRLPVLYRIGGAITIAFELSFIFLILSKRTRLMAAAAGIAFHNLTNLIMHVPFFQLQTCYVAFVDWSRLFAAAGRRMFKERTALPYNSECIECRRLVRAMKSVDVLRRIRYRHSADEQSLAKALHDQDNLFRLCLRLPLGFPMLVFARFSGASHAGAHEKRFRNRDDETAARNNRFSMTAVWFVGTALLCINGIFGATAKANAWPFACYPVYVIPERHADKLAIELQYANSGTVELNLSTSWPFLFAYHNRLWQYMWPVLKAPESMHARILDATWKMLAREHPQWKEAASVRFYRQRISTDPADPRVLDRKLLYELVQHPPQDSQQDSRRALD